MIDEPSQRTGDGHYKAYEEYAKALRTWFVAYGIGGPVLLLNNRDALEAVKNAGNGKLIAVLFLGGVAAQVVLAMINKSVNWLLYWGDESPRFAASSRYRMAELIAYQYWLDFTLDIAALICFGWATFLALQVLVK